MRGMVDWWSRSGEARTKSRLNIAGPSAGVDRIHGQPVVHDGSMISDVDCYGEYSWRGDANWELREEMRAV